MAKASDARAIAQRGIDGLSQANSDVLRRMMAVDVKVAGARDGQIHQGMPCKQFEHVVEETDPGSDAGFPLAVQIEPQADIGLASRASDFGDSGE